MPITEAVVLAEYRYRMRLAADWARTCERQGRVQMKPPSPDEKRWHYSPKPGCFIGRVETKLGRKKSVVWWATWGNPDAPSYRRCGGGRHRGPGLADVLTWLNEHIGDGAAQAKADEKRAEWVRAANNTSGRRQWKAQM